MKQTQSSGSHHLYFTATEVAARYRISLRKVRGMIASGELAPVLRFGRAVRIPLKALESYETAAR